MSNITIITGKNNSGKSELLQKRYKQAEKENKKVIFIDLSTDEHIFSLTEKQGNDLILGAIQEYYDENITNMYNDGYVTYKDGKRVYIRDMSASFKQLLQIFSLFHLDYDEFFIDNFNTHFHQDLVDILAEKIFKFCCENNKRFIIVSNDNTLIFSLAKNGNLIELYKNK